MYDVGLHGASVRDLSVRAHRVPRHANALLAGLAVPFLSWVGVDVT